MARIESQETYMQQTLQYQQGSNMNQYQHQYYQNTNLQPYQNNQQQIQQQQLYGYQQAPQGYQQVVTVYPQQNIEQFEQIELQNNKNWFNGCNICCGILVLILIILIIAVTNIGFELTIFGLLQTIIFFLWEIQIIIALIGLYKKNRILLFSYIALATFSLIFEILIIILIMIFFSGDGSGIIIGGLIWIVLISFYQGWFIVKAQKIRNLLSPNHATVSAQQQQQQ